MAEQIRVVEGLPPEQTAEGGACGGIPPVAQYYPRRSGGTRMAAKGFAAKGIERWLTPDIVGVMKTSAISALSIQVHEQISTKVITLINPEGKPMGPVVRSLVDAGLALVAGGVVSNVLKNRAFGIAWALGPLTIATSNIVSSVMHPGLAPAEPLTIPAGTPEDVAPQVEGIRSPGRVTAYNRLSRPPAVRLPYSGSEPAVVFRHAAGMGI